jgi:hypothetical protein
MAFREQAEDCFMRFYGLGMYRAGGTETNFLRHQYPDECRCSRWQIATRPLG